MAFERKEETTMRRQKKNRKKENVFLLPCGNALSDNQNEGNRLLRKRKYFFLSFLFTSSVESYFFVSLVDVKLFAA
jgi:hypothetical protein